MSWSVSFSAHKDVFVEQLEQKCGDARLGRTIPEQEHITVIENAAREFASLYTDTIVTVGVSGHSDDHGYGYFTLNLSSSRPMNAMGG